MGGEGARFGCRRVGNVGISAIKGGDPKGTVRHKEGGNES